SSATCSRAASGSSRSRCRTTCATSCSRPSRAASARRAEPRGTTGAGSLLARILTIAFNTYREAVRARLLLGVFAVALATCLYSVLVAPLSLHNEARVVADLGAAALSLFAVLIAVVLGSTSLYRELEHKTIFPILSRPLRRWEYLVGKYAGTLLTVLVFV